MSGYISNVIANIRGNLDERYRDGYAILKEMIQNADDAGAEELTVTFVQRIEGLKHPLLQGPLVFIANNAAFTYQNAQAIHQERGGSSGGDETKIGRFGLGLKSIYHLCEAFFYLSDPQGDMLECPPELADFKRSDFINPWFKTRYRDWDQSWNRDANADIELLRRHMQLFLMWPSQKWLAIVIPLRLRRHCIEKSTDIPDRWALVKDGFFDDRLSVPPQKIFGREQLIGLIRTMPLLSTLSTIEFRHSCSHNDIRIIAQLNRRPNEGENVSWKAMDPGRRRHSGLVTLNLGEETRTQQYIGYHELLNDSALSAISSDKGNWPEVDVLKEGGFDRDPAEALQHVGVVLLDSPKPKSVSLTETLFLPLGALPERVEDELNFELLLHGYYFVDSGRNGIDKPDSNAGSRASQRENNSGREQDKTETIRQRWNRRLTEIGVFPLIIPSIELYAQKIAKEEGAFERIETLTRLLMRHKEIVAHLPHICRHHEWSFRLSDKEFSWRSSDKAKQRPLIELPATSDTALPRSVFPALDDWADQSILTIAELPLLTVQAPEIPEGFMADVLQTIEIDKLRECPKQWSYFIRCIEIWKKHFSAPEYSLLVNLAKDYIEATEFNFDDETRQLVKLIPGTLLLVVSMRLPLSKTDDTLLKCVWAANSAILAVPRTLAEGRALAKLNASNALELIQQVLECGRSLRSGTDQIQSDAVVDSENDSRAVERLVLDLLESTEAGLTAEDEKLAGISMWCAKSGTRSNWFSLKELHTLAAENRLYEADGETEDYLRCLSSEVEHRPILISKRAAATVRRFRWISSISRFDESGFIDFLKQKPQLSEDSKPRTKLATQIARHHNEKELSEAQKTAIRYLLHGSKVDSDISAPLLVDNADAWSTFASAVLSAKQQSWRLVPPSMTQFEPQVCHALGICACTPEIVVSLLASITDMTRIDLLALSNNPEHLKQVLFDWPEGNLQVLRSLKLFRPCGDQKLVDAVSRVFIQGTLPKEVAGLFGDYTFLSDETGMLAFRGIAPSMKPVDLLKEALRQEAVHEYWEFICNILQQHDIGEPTWEALRKAPWLPVDDGTSVSPEDCVCTDGLEPLVKGLRDRKATIAHKQQLRPELIRSKVWAEKVRNLCPVGFGILDVIGRELTNLGGYEIGESLLSHVCARDFLSVFAVAPKELMPVASVVDSLEKNLTLQNLHDAIRDRVLSPLQKRLHDDRYEGVLTYLCDLPNVVADEDPKDTLFDLYLKDAVQSPTAESLLSRIKLRNRRGDYVGANRLTISATNVDAKHLVDEVHAEILSGLVRSKLSKAVDTIAARPSRSIPNEAAIKASPRILFDQLRSWRTDDIPSDALAAVVAVMGNHDGYPEFYGQLNPERSKIEDMWSLLNISLALKQTANRFCLYPDNSETILVTSLLGEEFQADASDVPESFFDSMSGMPDHHQETGGTRIFQLRIRPSKTQKLTTAQKLNVLRNSIEDIRRYIWKCQSSFDTAWQTLTAEDQLELNIAQREILGACSVILESQLAVGRDSDGCLKRLSEVLLQHHAAQTEYFRAASDKSSVRQAAAIEKRRSTRRQICNLLVSDSNTQKGVMKEIRDRLASQNYEVASVPFEMFQNADDAVAELKTHCSAEFLDNIRPKKLLRTFCVESHTNDSRVAFYHWGRAINQYRIGDRSIPRFKRDLEKMLVLQGSGKVHESGVTGHFGLGFKSVFFVTDEPRVFSGSKSRFVVKSGIYPDKLEESDEVRLGDILRVLESCEVPTGTAIELPVRAEQPLADILGCFRQYAGYLVHFSREIHRIDFAGDSPFSVERRECALMPSVALANGLDSNGQRAILFRIEIPPILETLRATNGKHSSATVLLHIDVHGLPQAICSGSEADTATFPEVWVTTPAFEHRGCGTILLNADLEVNPGRSRLRDTDRNNNYLKEIGRIFGEQLCRFYDETQDNHKWTKISSSLFPSACMVSAHLFWKAFWDACLPVARRPSTDPIKRILLADGCGLNKLLREKAVIPTLLPAPFDQPVKLGDIQHQCAGLLGSSTRWEILSQRMIGKKSTLERMQLVVKPGTFVSSKCASDLSAIGVSELLGTWECLTLADVISMSISDDHPVSSRLASALVRAVSDDIIPQWDDSGDAGNSRAVLRSLPFLTEDPSGRTVKARDALAEDFSTVEESLLAALSPKKFVLLASYDKSAVSFMQFCRGPFQLETNELAERCIKADSEQRIAVVQYLARGQQATVLRSHFEKHTDAMRRSWLNDERQLAEAMSMSKLSEYDRQMCRAVLNRHPVQSDHLPNRLNRPKIQAKFTFESIALWWNENRAELITEHDKRVYPDGQMPAITFRNTLEDLQQDQSVRREWLMLMIRGQLFRLGYKDYQHRGFLCVFFQSKVWGLMLEGLVDPVGWFMALDDYLDRSTEKQTYFHWMNQILAFYQLTRWLPEYVRAFDGITRIGANLESLASIVDITNQRYAHIFNRATGFTAPPCQKTLGIGAHFILREVLRSHRFQDPLYRTQLVLARMSFVPSASVRRLFCEITGDTEFESNKDSELCAKLMFEKAAEFLEDPTFGNCFDMPFRMLTWKKYAAKRTEIFGSNSESTQYTDEDGVDSLDEENSSL